ncbi:MAG: hypothetical protein J5793_05005 [Clostridia bacterium]|nr:hypothetical protein [Clostridia bacterium]
MKRFIAILLALIVMIPLTSAFAVNAEMKLVSRGKSYTVSGCGTGHIDGSHSYNAALTDGAVRSTVSYGADQWFSISPQNTGNGANALPVGNKKVCTVIIDLGKVTEQLATARVHMTTPGVAGIGEPTEISVSVSEDGFEYTSKLASASGFQAVSEAYWVTLGFGAGYSARYVRFQFTVTANHNFIDELEVYTDSTAPRYVPGVSKANAGKVVVDGDVTDEGWALNGWEEVTSATGFWQSAASTDDTLNYKYQFRSDGSYLYGAVIVGHDLIDGGNSGTKVRIWLHQDPSANVYTHFIDLYTLDNGIQADVRKCNSLVSNTGTTLLSNTGIKAAYRSGTGSVRFEFCVPLVSVCASSGISYFICVSECGPTCLYNKGRSGPSSQTGYMPYNDWDEDNETVLSLSDLGFVNYYPATVAEFAEAAGVAYPDSEFDITASIPSAGGVRGETLAVTFSFVNITSADLAWTDFTVRYDPDILSLVYNEVDDVGGDGELVISGNAVFPGGSNAWESLSYYDADYPGRIAIRFASTVPANAAVNDGDLSVTLTFRVANDAPDSVGLWVPNGSVRGGSSDMDSFPGNGCYLVFDVSDPEAGPGTVDYASAAGADNAGAKFDVLLSFDNDVYRTAGYAGLTVNVENVNAYDIMFVEFDVRYDPEKLEFIYDADGDIGGDGELLLDSFAVHPGSADSWESMSYFDPNAPGTVRVRYGTASQASVASGDGDLYFVFPFRIKGNADEGTAGAWVPSSSVYGGSTEYEEYRGNGSVDTFTVSAATRATMLTATAVLQGKLAIAFKLALPEAILNDSGAFVRFTGTNGYTDVLVSDATVSGGNRVFIYRLTAKEYRDKINLRLYCGNGDGAAIIGNSGTDYANGVDYSLETYVEKISVQSSDADMIALARTMDYYGTAAQLYFGYNSDGLSLPSEVTSVTASQLNEYAGVFEGSLPSGITGRTIALQLVTGTRLRITFKSDSSVSPNDYTFRIDDRQVYPSRQDDGSYYLDVSGIAAKDLDDAHTFSVSYGGTDYTVTASALTYARACVVNGDTARANLGKALYLYNQAANVYFHN